MSTRAKRIVPIGLTALAAIGLAACRATGPGRKGPRGEMPIEVTDGSITLHFDGKFTRVGNQKLTAKLAKHKAQRIEVLDRGAKDPFLTVDVTGREWSITSDSGPATISKIAPPAGQDDELSITATQGQFVQESETAFHHDNANVRFAPATLSLTGFSRNIPLFCPSDLCQIKIFLKE